MITLFVKYVSNFSFFVAKSGGLDTRFPDIEIQIWNIAEQSTAYTRKIVGSRKGCLGVKRLGRIVTNEKMATKSQVLINETTGNQLKRKIFTSYIIHDLRRV